MVQVMRGEVGKGLDRAESRPIGSGLFEAGMMTDFDSYIGGYADASARLNDSWSLFARGELVSPLDKFEAVHGYGIAGARFRW